uniref:Uncharacterized protein n=1 Tax=Arundo donax TaxID=35708 RepID=A0A0A9FQA6_ARUDO
MEVNSKSNITMASAVIAKMYQHLQVSTKLLLENTLCMPRI